MSEDPKLNNDQAGQPASNEDINDALNRSRQVGRGMAGKLMLGVAGVGVAAGVGVGSEKLLSHGDTEVTPGTPAPASAEPFPTSSSKADNIKVELPSVPGTAEGFTVTVPASAVPAESAPARVAPEAPTAPTAPTAEIPVEVTAPEQAPGPIEASGVTPAPIEAAGDPTQIPEGWPPTDTQTTGAHGDPIEVVSDGTNIVGMIPPASEGTPSDTQDMTTTPPTPPAEVRDALKVTATEANGPGGQVTKAYDTDPATGVTTPEYDVPTSPPSGS